MKVVSGGAKRIGRRGGERVMGREKRQEGEIGRNQKRHHQKRMDGQNSIRRKNGKSLMNLLEEKGVGG